MRIATIGCVLVLMAGRTAWAQGTPESPNQPQPPLVFEVAARGYLVGGRAGSLAGDSAVDKLESYVWADQMLCVVGAGNQAPQSVPWTGWHFTGTAIPNLPGELVIDLHWERVWENGARVQGGTSGARTYRIRSGERVEIDRITPPTVGPCGTVELKLEAAVMTRAAYLMSPTGGVSGGMRGGVIAGPRGGAAGRGAGSGSGMGASAGVASPGAGGRGAGTGAGAPTAGDSKSQKTFTTMRILKEAYDAEIWLVHKKPDGTEVVQQQTVRFGAAPKPFVFPPEEVPGGGGPITVDIRGSLQLNGPGLRFYNFSPGYGGRGVMAGQFARSGQTPAGTETPTTLRFMLSIARHARRATPFVDTRGATDMSIEVPKSDDVLSFELPPLQKATEDLLKGHTFSIRVRMTPVK